MSKKILITGAIAYDVLLGFEGSFTDSIDPAQLETLSVSHFSPHYARHFGGTGSNIAWNMHLLGGEPYLVGAVGRDGDDYIDLFKDKGIDVGGMEKLEDHVTATAIIGTDNAERQIAFFHPGADSHVEWPQLNPADYSYAVISPRDMSMMMQGLEWCHENKVPVLFDPGQQVHMFGDDEMQRLIRMSDAVIGNEYEWGIIKKKCQCEEADLLSECPLLFVTKGEQGVEIHQESGTTLVPAFTPDQVVNPTGAGDAFRAGLLVGLQSDMPVEDAAKLGNAIASFAVEVEGTLIEHADRAKILERMALS